MKVLVVLPHSGFYRHLETACTYLCEQGHEVKVLTREGRKGRKEVDEEYQQEMLSTVAAYPTGSYAFSVLKPRGPITWRVRRSRTAWDYGVYYRVQHNSPQLRRRQLRLAPRWGRWLFPTRLGRWLVSSNSVLAAFRRWEAHLPASRKLMRQIRDENPDVVIGCPFLYRLSADVEYIRAAQKLGIPTISVVASWDNLTTKGPFALLTDAVFVWNDGLAKEASLVHAIPRDRLVSTGAPKFDHYFELEPSVSREEFCSHVGLDPSRPYLLYIGSSRQVAGDETGFVQELTSALEEDPRTAPLQVLVRPHPLNGQVWETFEDERIAVYPRGGQRPDIPGARDEYFHTLQYAAAVVGVNTSAFLEAAITDRPCLSIVSERHRAGQVDRGHFQHLLKGRFIETVPDFEGAVAALGTLLEGRDPRHGLRRRFVERFVRPGGIDRRAGEVAAEAILEVARRGPREPEPIRPRKVAQAPRRIKEEGRRKPPPTEEQERGALMRLHDEHPVEVRQPLALVSELGTGGDVLGRLLDGHPACHGRPGLLAIDRAQPGSWPSLDLSARPEEWLAALHEPATPDRGNGTGPEADGVPFLLLPALQRRVFEHCVEHWQPTTQRAVLDAYMTSFFNAWLDYQRLYADGVRWVTAFGGGLGLGGDNQRAFFDDYPDGRLLVVVRDPGSEESVESVADTKREHGERVLVVDLPELAAGPETVMREVAGFLEIDFDPVLCRPTVNGLPAGSPPVSARR
jgi:hypothetical protein